jgi:hypothetical protein
MADIEKGMGYIVLTAGGILLALLICGVVSLLLG